MKTLDALGALAGISADQWGMVTSAQATSAGVTRLDMSRLCRAGHLLRLGHGVYKDAGAGDDDLEELRAVWLSTQPTALAADRLDRPDVVVAVATAAWVHQIGDLEPQPYVFGTSQRRQTQRDELRYVRRDYGPEDVTVVRGLPVTTVERTIGDLLRDRVDRSLVSDVLSDAVMAGSVDIARLAEVVGTPTLDDLLASAGLDPDALAAKIARSPMTDAIVRSVYDDAVRHVMESVHKAMQPALQAAARSYEPVMRASRAATPQLPVMWSEAQQRAADAIVSSIGQQVMVDTQETLQTLGRVAARSDALAAHGRTSDRIAESYLPALRLGYLDGESTGDDTFDPAPARGTKGSE